MMLARVQSMATLGMQVSGGVLQGLHIKLRQKSHQRLEGLNVEMPVQVLPVM